MNPIVNGLIRIAINIGKWILDVAARRGGKWLAEYLEERANSVFGRRLGIAIMKQHIAKLASAKRRWGRRMDWLRGRIQRWLAAAKWLRAKAATLDNAVIDTVCALPQVKALPISAVCEEEPA